MERGASVARRSEEAPLLERSEGNRQPESREVVSRPDNGMTFTRERRR